MRQVFLVRHASHDRLGRILCGRMPGVSLSEQGRAEAEALADALGRRIESEAPLLTPVERQEGGGAPASGENPAAESAAIRVLSSPQTRTQETAAPLAHRLGTQVETADEIDEIEFGAWTGRAFADLDAEPAWATWNAERASAHPPGGESMGEAQARALRLLDRLGCADGPPTILVSHADTIRAALLGVLGLGLDAYDRIVVAPASWSELALWPGGGRIVSINERVSP